MDTLGILVINYLLTNISLKIIIALPQIIELVPGSARGRANQYTWQKMAKIIHIALRAKREDDLTHSNK